MSKAHTVAVADFASYKTELMLASGNDRNDNRKQMFAVISIDEMIEGKFKVVPVVGKILYFDDIDAAVTAYNDL